MSGVSERLLALKDVGRDALVRIPSALPDIAGRFLKVTIPLRGIVLSKPEPDPGFRFQPFLDAQETTRRYENLALLTEYDQFDQDIKSGVAGDDIKAAKKRQAELAGQILDRAGFTRITPANDSVVHTQMHANEKVHECAGVDELVARRVGEDETDKASFALLLDLPEGQKILANIYTYFTHAADEQGRLKHRALPGFVDAIKDGKPKAVTAHECNTAVFYSISSAIMGGGARLIQWVYQELSSQYILTTLSPIRDFTKGKDRDAWLARPKEDVQRDVLKYLLENKDPVMKFHLANGAYVGDININPHSERDWITINYVYPVDAQRLEKNARLYKNKGIMHMSAYLHDMVDEDDLSRAQCFADGDNIPIVPKKPMTFVPTPA